MNHVDFNHMPHRRFNLLTGEWLLVSPHRSKRPWDGQQEPPDTSKVPPYLPECYLCPANVRTNGQKNPAYTGTYVFDNDFSALLPIKVATQTGSDDTLLRAEPENGICRVICYSPRHDLTIARMQEEQVITVVKTWIGQYRDLGRRPEINHVQIFENRGQIMGCSNPHPHGQIWANSTIPTIPAKETKNQKDYLKNNKSCLLCDYLQREIEENNRILFINESFAALVPFWATWPYETIIIPRFHSATIETLMPSQQVDLARIMIELGICYDNLFSTSFPYSMGIHQQPTDGSEHPEWHWHIHYMPPLLRSKSVKKHMVGYEIMAMPQRDITPEKAAHMLRELPKAHYLDRSNH